VQLAGGVPGVVFELSELGGVDDAVAVGKFLAGREVEAGVKFFVVSCKRYLLTSPKASRL
jgi:hypothetical protein